MRRVSWEMVRFTDQQDRPVYIDLTQVAAVTSHSDHTLLLDGTRVVLASGFALFVKESAEAVFAEVHRANTQPPPPPAPNKFGAAAPAMLGAQDPETDH